MPASRITRPVPPGAMADPDWPAYLQASGHLIVAQEDRLLRAATLNSVLAFNAAPSGAADIAGA